MPSKGAFGIETLREAVLSRVKETTVRAVAAEIGMSHSGLHVLLNGSTPHPKTRDKLVAWYLERKATGATHDVPTADVDAAINVLVHYVRAKSSPEAQARRVREVIRRFAREVDPDGAEGGSSKDQ